MSIENIVNDKLIAKFSKDHIARRVQIRLLEDNGMEYFHQLDDEWKDDKELALYVLAKRPMFLHYTSDKIKNDKDVVSACLNHALLNNDHLDKKAILEKEHASVQSFKFASEEIRNNKAFIRFFLPQLPRLVYFMDTSLLSDRELMLDFIKFHPASMSQCVKELREDKSFILDAVNQNVLCLWQAPPKWKYDRDVLDLCIAKDPIRTWDVYLDGITILDLENWIKIFNVSPLVLDRGLKTMETMDGIKKDDTYNIFFKWLSTRNESFFLESLTKIDFTDIVKFEVNDLYPVSNDNAQMVNLILSHISKESLEKITIKNNCLQFFVDQAIKNKTILSLDLKSAKKPKNKSRKVY